MFDVEPTTRLKKHELTTLRDDRSQYRAIHCPRSFEDRFFDPDHPRDSDRVSDIDYRRR